MRHDLRARRAVVTMQPHRPAHGQVPPLREPVPRIQASSRRVCHERHEGIWWGCFADLAEQPGQHPVADAPALVGREDGHVHDMEVPPAVADHSAARSAAVRRHDLSCAAGTQQSPKQVDLDQLADHPDRGVREFTDMCGQAGVVHETSHRSNAAAARAVASPIPRHLREVAETRHCPPRDGDRLAGARIALKVWRRRRRTRLMCSRPA